MANINSDNSQFRNLISDINREISQMPEIASSVKLNTFLYTVKSLSIDNETISDIDINKRTAQIDRAFKEACDDIATINPKLASKMRSCGIEEVIKSIKENPLDTIGMVNRHDQKVKDITSASVKSSIRSPFDAKSVGARENHDKSTLERTAKTINLNRTPKNISISTDFDINKGRENVLEKPANPIGKKIYDDLDSYIKNPNDFIAMDYETVGGNINDDGFSPTEVSYIKNGKEYTLYPKLSNAAQRRFENIFKKIDRGDILTERELADIERMASYTLVNGNITTSLIKRPTLKTLDDVKKYEKNILGKAKRGVEIYSGKGGARNLLDFPEGAKGETWTEMAPIMQERIGIVVNRVAENSGYEKRVDMGYGIKTGKEVDPMYIFRKSFNVGDVNPETGIILKSYRESDIASFMGVDLNQAHTAINDVKAMIGMLNKMVSSHPEKIKEAKEGYKQNDITGKATVATKYHGAETGAFQYKIGKNGVEVLTEPENVGDFNKGGVVFRPGEIIKAEGITKGTFGANTPSEIQDMDYTMLHNISTGERWLIPQDEYERQSMLVGQTTGKYLNYDTNDGKLELDKTSAEQVYNWFVQHPDDMFNNLQKLFTSNTPTWTFRRRALQKNPAMWDEFMGLKKTVFGSGLANSKAMAIDKGTSFLSGWATIRSTQAGGLFQSLLGTDTVVTPESLKLGIARVISNFKEGGIFEGALRSDITVEQLETQLLEYADNFKYGDSLYHLDNVFNKMLSSDFLKRGIEIPKLLDRTNEPKVNANGGGKTMENNMDNAKKDFTNLENLSKNFGDLFGLLGDLGDNFSKNPKAFNAVENIYEQLNRLASAFDGSAVTKIDSFTKSIESLITSINSIQNAKIKSNAGKDINEKTQSIISGIGQIQEAINVGETSKVKSFIQDTKNPKGYLRSRYTPDNSSRIYENTERPMIYIPKPSLIGESEHKSIGNTKDEIAQYFWEQAYKSSGANPSKMRQWITQNVFNKYAKGSVYGKKNLGDIFNRLETSEFNPVMVDERYSDALANGNEYMKALDDMFTNLSRDSGFLGKLGLMSNMSTIGRNDNALVGADELISNLVLPGGEYLENRLKAVGANTQRVSGADSRLRDKLSSLVNFYGENGLGLGIISDPKTGRIGFYNQNDYKDVITKIGDETKINWDMMAHLDLGTINKKNQSVKIGNQALTDYLMPEINEFGEQIDDSFITFSMQRANDIMDVLLRKGVGTKIRDFLEGGNSTGARSFIKAIMEDIAYTPKAQETYRNNTIEELNNDMYAGDSAMQQALRANNVNYAESYKRIFNKYYQKNNIYDGWNDNTQEGITWDMARYVYEKALGIEDTFDTEGLKWLKTSGKGISALDRLAENAKNNLPYIDWAGMKEAASRSGMVGGIGMGQFDILDPWTPAYYRGKSQQQRYLKRSENAKKAIEKLGYNQEVTHGILDQGGALSGLFGLNKNENFADQPENVLYRGMQTDNSFIRDFYEYYYKKLGETLQSSNTKKEIEMLYKRYIGELPSNFKHKDLLKTLKEKRMLPSVDEGNVIMSDKIAQTMESVVTRKLTLTQDDWNRLNFSRGLGVPDLNENGEGYNIDKKLGALSKDFRAGGHIINAGDIITNVERTGDEFTISFDHISHALRMLSDARETVFRISDAEMEALNKYSRAIGKLDATRDLDFISSDMGNDIRRIGGHSSRAWRALLDEAKSAGKTNQEVTEALNNSGMSNYFSVVGNKDDKFQALKASYYFNGLSKDQQSELLNNLWVLDKNEKVNNNNPAFLRFADSLGLTQHAREILDSNLYSSVARMANEYEYTGFYNEDETRYSVTDRERDATARLLGEMEQSGVNVDALRKFLDARIGLAKTEKNEILKANIENARNAYKSNLPKNNTAPADIIISGDINESGQPGTISLQDIQTGIQMRKNGLIAQGDYKTSALGRIANAANEMPGRLRSAAIKLSRPLMMDGKELSQIFLPVIHNLFDSDDEYVNPGELFGSTNALINAVKEYENNPDSENIQEKLRTQLARFQQDISNSQLYYKGASASQLNKYKIPYAGALTARGENLTGDTRQLAPNEIGISYNTAYKMLTATDVGNREGLIKNLSALSGMYKKFGVGGNNQDYHFKDSSLSDLLKDGGKGLEGVSNKELKSLEGKLAEQILQSDNSEIIVGAHRFPFTLGKDQKFAKLRVFNDEYGDNTIVLPEAYRYMMNADFDSDKIYLQSLFSGMEWDEDAYDQARYTVENFGLQAVNMQKLLEADKALSQAQGETSADRNDKAIKAYNQFMDDQTDHNQTMIAELEKKSYAQIGMFSNAASSIKTLMSQLKLDETGDADVQTKVAAIMTRNLLATLEENTISAKRIGERINSGEKLTPEEINHMYHDIQRMSNFMYGIKGMDESGNIQNLQEFYNTMEAQKFLEGKHSGRVTRGAFTESEQIIHEQLFKEIKDSMGWANKELKDVINSDEFIEAYTEAISPGGKYSNLGINPYNSVYLNSKLLDEIIRKPGAATSDQIKQYERIGKFGATKETNDDDIAKQSAKYMFEHGFSYINEKIENEDEGNIIQQANKLRRASYVAKTNEDKEYQKLTGKLTGRDWYEVGGYGRNTTFDNTAFVNTLSIEEKILAVLVEMGNVIRQNNGSIKDGTANASEMLSVTQTLEQQWLAARKNMEAMTKDGKAFDLGNGIFYRPIGAKQSGDYVSSHKYEFGNLEGMESAPGARMSVTQALSIALGEKGSRGGPYAGIQQRFDKIVDDAIKEYDELAKEGDVDQQQLGDILSKISDRTMGGEGAFWQVEGALQEDVEKWFKRPFGTYAHNNIENTLNTINALKDLDFSNTSFKEDSDITSIMSSIKNGSFVIRDIADESIYNKLKDALNQVERYDIASNIEKYRQDFLSDDIRFQMYASAMYNDPEKTTELIRKNRSNVDTATRNTTDIIQNIMGDKGQYLGSEISLGALFATGNTSAFDGGAIDTLVTDSEGNLWVLDTKTGKGGAKGIAQTTVYADLLKKTHENLQNDEKSKEYFNWSENDLKNEENRKNFRDWANKNQYLIGTDEITDENFDVQYKRLKATYEAPDVFAKLLEQQTNGQIEIKQVVQGTATEILDIVKMVARVLTGDKITQEESDAFKEKLQSRTISEGTEGEAGEDRTEKGDSAREAGTAALTKTQSSKFDQAIKDAKELNGLLNEVRKFQNAANDSTTSVAERKNAAKMAAMAQEQVTNKMGNMWFYDSKNNVVYRAGMRDENGNYAENMENVGWFNVGGSKNTEEFKDFESKYQAVMDKRKMDEMETGTQSPKYKETFFDKVFGGLKQTAQFLARTTLIYGVIGKIKQAFATLTNEVKTLDMALTKLQIVTRSSREDLQESIQGYTKLANEMGVSTQTVLQAAETWLRAGYNISDANTLIRETLKLSTLGMMDANQAATALISTMKGWDIGVDRLKDVVDNVTALDSAFATTSGDIMTAMSKANVSASLSGMGIKDFESYITTILDTSQLSAETVGTSMKTLIARFGNVKAGKFTSAYGEDSENQEEFTALNDIEKVLNKVGVQTRNTIGEFRNMNEVIEDIAENWGSYDRVTQNAITTAMAGVRQREALNVLFENYDTVKKAQGVIGESEGTADEKYEYYMDSIQAAQNRMTSSFEKYVTNSDFYKDFMVKFYDIGTNILSSLKTIITIFTAGGALLMFSKMASDAGYRSKMSNMFGAPGRLFNNVQPIERFRMIGRGIAAKGEKVGYWGQTRRDLKEEITSHNIYKPRAGLPYLQQMHQNRKDFKEARADLKRASRLENYQNRIQNTLENKVFDQMQQDTFRGAIKGANGRYIATTPETIQNAGKGALNLLTDEEGKTWLQNYLKADDNTRQQMLIDSEKSLDELKEQYKQETGKRAITSGKNSGNWQKWLANQQNQGQDMPQALKDMSAEERQLMARYIEKNPEFAKIFAKIFEGTGSKMDAYKSLREKYGGQVSTGAMIVGTVGTQIAAGKKGIAGNLEGSGVDSQTASNVATITGSLPMIGAMLGPEGAIAASIISVGIGLASHLKDMEITTETEMLQLRSDLNNGLKGIIEAQDNINEIKNKETKFKSLARGVNQDTGENVGLSQEEYEEYQKMLKELSDGVEGLSLKKDSEGNQVIMKDGQVLDVSIDGFDELLKAAKETAYNTAQEQVQDEKWADKGREMWNYASKDNLLLNTAENLTNIDKTILEKAVKKGESEAQKRVSGNSSGMNPNTVKEFAKEEIRKELVEQNIDSGEIDKLLEIYEDFNNVDLENKDSLSEAINKYSDAIIKQSRVIKDIDSTMSKRTKINMQATEAFQELDENQQNLLTSMGNSVASSAMKYSTLDENGEAIGYGTVLDVSAWLNSTDNVEKMDAAYRALVDWASLNPAAMSFIENFDEDEATSENWKTYKNYFLEMAQYAGKNIDDNATRWAFYGSVANALGLQRTGKAQNGLGSWVNTKQANLNELSKQGIDLNGLGLNTNEVGWIYKNKDWFKNIGNDIKTNGVYDVNKIRSYIENQNIGSGSNLAELYSTMKTRAEKFGFGGKKYEGVNDKDFVKYLRENADDLNEDSIAYQKLDEIAQDYNLTVDELIDNMDTLNNVDVFHHTTQTLESAKQELEDIYSISKDLKKDNSLSFDSLDKILKDPILKEKLLPVLGDKKAMAEQIKIIEGLEARAFVAPLKTALDDSAEVFASNIEKAISKTPIKIEFEDLEGNVKEVDLSGGMLEYYKRAFKNTTQLLEYTDALKNFGKLTYDNEDEGHVNYLESFFTVSKDNMSKENSNENWYMRRYGVSNPSEGSYRDNMEIAAKNAFDALKPILEELVKSNIMSQSSYSALQNNPRLYYQKLYNIDTAIQLSGYSTASANYSSALNDYTSLVSGYDAAKESIYQDALSEALSELEDKYEKGIASEDDYIKGLEKLKGTAYATAEQLREINEKIEEAKANKLNRQWEDGALSLEEYQKQLSGFMKQNAKDSSDYLDFRDKFLKSFDDEIAKIKAVSDIYDEHDYDAKHNSLLSQREILMNKLAALEAAGKKESQEWYNVKKDIYDVDKNLLENDKARLEYQIQLKENVMDAYTGLIDYAIKQLEDQKEAVNEYYDNEISKLEDVNDAKKRSIELTKLQQELENAKKEKVRVYQAGVGWTYQENKGKVKEARQNLENFQDEQHISDLKNAQEKEIKYLDDIINRWEDMKKVVEDTKATADAENALYTLITNGIVDEGSTIPSALRQISSDTTTKGNDIISLGKDMDKILGDWKLNYETYTQQWTGEAWDQKMKDISSSALNAIVDDDAKTAYAEAMSAGISNASVDLDLSGLNALDQAIKDAKDALDTATTELNKANKLMDLILKHTYSETGQSAQDVLATANQRRESEATGRPIKVTRNPDKYTLVYDNFGNQYAYVNGHYFLVDGTNVKKDDSGKLTISGSAPVYKPGSYASGIEVGPVTTTGLQLLHGSPNNPEYVLNSKQAYTLLKNMATMQISPYTAKGTYTGSEKPSETLIFNGGINLPNVQSPDEFFDELLREASNKFDIYKTEY